MTTEGVNLLTMERNRRMLFYMPFIKIHFPAGPFTILESRDQEIGEFYVVKKRCATYFEATKMLKVLSGRASQASDEKFYAFSP